MQHQKEHRFYAKYRGSVVDNVDPNKLGRVQVQVPYVLGPLNTLWAMPSEPYAGKGVGFFAIPPVGAELWVEFENGDPTLPIWAGGYWTATADIPVQPPIPDVKAFCTEGMFLAHNNNSDENTSVTVENVAVDRGLTLYVTSPVLTDEQGYLKLFMGVDGKILIDNNNHETITMTKDSIVISKDGKVVVTLTNNDSGATTYEATTGSNDLKMDETAGTITTTNGTGTMKITKDDVTSTIGASTVKLETSSIDSSCGAGDVKITVESVNITNGPASVSLSGPSVAVNEEALVVT